MYSETVSEIHNFAFMSFNSIEFYIIAAMVAAAVVAFASKPSRKGVARTILQPGALSHSGLEEKSIQLTCNDDGTVILIRHGIEGVNKDGAVSIAITVIAFDITIEERIVPGRITDDVYPDTATFTLDFMAEERCHISYHSETTGLFTATTIHNRPGIHITKHLQ